ncbi:hypothetical protein [Gemmata sp.]|uniref:hypothetical protein n=1 Tax=Gemmata sp. TaxID=1914242 RepID=UPI003F72AC83
MTPVTIEIKNPGNRSYLFKPLMQSVRGAIDFQSSRDPEWYALGMEFGGKPIPGQRIMLDIETGRGVVFDPLLLPENAATADKLRAMLSGPVKGSGIKFAEPKESTGVHAATWLWHMRRAVESGCAVVVSGDINAQVDGVPQTEFLHKRPQPTDRRDDIIATLIEQNRTQSEQIAKLLAAK